LQSAVRIGQISALYVFDPGPSGSLGDVQWILNARAAGKLPLLIVQGVLLTELARAADFVLPGASYVEKEASYTNDQGRLQAAARAIPAPGEAMEDWQILVNLGAALGVRLDYTSPALIRADIAETIGVGFEDTTLAFPAP
jgi:predicted molibdopterin-dependent oxidoreductase YjgC